MRKFKLSICIPCFNNAQFIKQAITSALSYGDKFDVEVVVVDDFSQDNSWEIVEKFKPFVIALKNTKNIGMLENWNRCVENSSGQYIVVMGGDDLISSNSFDTCIEMMDRDQEISLSAITRNIIDEKGRILLRGNSNNGIKIKNGRYFIELSVLLGKNLVGEPVCCIFRREDYYKVGGFSAINNYTADLCMWMKFAKIGKIAKLNSSGADFRISSDSNGSKIGFKQIIEFYEFINFAKKELNISFIFCIAGKVTSIFCFVARQVFFILVKKFLK